MDDMTTYPPIHRSRGRTSKSVVTSRGAVFTLVLDAFARGLTVMASFGVVQPVRLHKSRPPSDAAALAGDWATVGLGLRRSIREARPRVGR